MAPREAHILNQNWFFKATDQGDDELREVQSLPTNIHLDLLRHKLIPDPFFEKNEDLVQWVGEKQWVYQTKFTTPDSALSKDGSPKKKSVLSFEGLDTFATVLLNGKTILETESMFVAERVDVTDLLRPQEESNELVITFDSAYMRGWKLIEDHPEHKWGGWNGDTSRFAVRKAQYHWGWDWGPTLLTCGPWRPISLETFESRISDLYFNTSVDESLKSATIEATTEVEGDAARVKFEVSLDGTAVASETVDVSSGKALATFHKSNPSLWYPVGYGKQPLYTIQATLLGADDTKTDTVSKRIGLRRAEMVQQPLKEQPGRSFFFRINNIPIFCGGSNWIPADNFIPRIGDSTYHDWVKLVASGNQCMIRVWGGGIYEEAAFYDACDEQGILVWQDFMFACGNYPTWPSMLDSIRREAESNIKLIRHHPSVVIWAGNNEDYQYRESQKLTYDPEDKDPQNWLKTDFPARYIYEELLAKACKTLIPNTYYHPGSPFSPNGLGSSDPTVGDLHQWNVWHGRQEPYQDWDQLIGRFVSEFGMQALPSAHTIDAFLSPNSPNRYEQSSILDHHNKAAEHARRSAAYLVTNLRYPTEGTLEASVYASQLVQAECLAASYRLWRRQWKGEGREYCGGALVWQINDCWPCTSWAIADYFLRPKMAWYAIKREMDKLTVGVVRKEHRHPKNKYSRVEDVQTKAEVWASNLGLEDVVVDVVLGAWDVISGEPYETGLDGGSVLKKALRLPANSSVEILEATALKALNTPEEKRRDVVLAAYLFPTSKDSSSPSAAETFTTEVFSSRHQLREPAPLARCVNWPEPLKYIDFPAPHILRPTVVVAEGRKVVEVYSEVPVKGVVFAAEPDSDEGEPENAKVEAAKKVVFVDNCVDLVPKEVVRVGVEGLEEGLRVTVRFLGMDYHERGD